MIDIHSHIIYDIDDGARTLEEAVRLVRLDARQGVTDIFSTSHYSVSHPTSKREIFSKLGEIREKLDIRGIQVQLHPGHEVLYFDSMPEHLRKGKILTLAGSAYVLVEFYPTDAYQRFLSAVRQIRRCGYLPIIAHAERFPALRKHGLSEILEEGAYIQVSTEPLSFTGLRGMMNEECRFIKEALKKEQAHFFGSDMHRLHTRPPVVQEAIEWANRHLSRGYAAAVLYENAECILEDREIDI